MTETFLQKLGFPAASHLGKRVFKKLFLENASLAAADKKAFKDDVESVIWQYTLKPSTIPIKPYTDDTREYLEVAVLEVVMRSQRPCKRLAEAIHRSIPYPLLLAFSCQTACSLSLAPKRFSQAEKGALVAEEYFTTGWINLQKPSTVEQAFLESLPLSGLPHTHFYAFYSSLLDRFVAYNCALLNGEFRIDHQTITPEERKKGLEACHALEGRITEFKASLRKETQFNRKVELNTQIKQLEQQLRHLSATL